MSKFPVVGWWMSLPLEHFFLVPHQVVRYSMARKAFYLNTYRKTLLFNTGQEHIYKLDLAYQTP
jgi:hypothetical protein